MAGGPESEFAVTKFKEGIKEEREKQRKENQPLIQFYPIFRF
jgi:hypothetical protein